MMSTKLDQFSKCMCLAKWTQLTIDLEAGTQASCHHPMKHPIEISLLHHPHLAFHNTPYKMLVKSKMLKGQRPKECEYCWSIEDSQESFSDRIFKSTQHWSSSRIQEIENDPLSADLLPSYVEVNLGRSCQMKCSYCSSDISSAWADEVKQFGPYLTSGLHGKLPHRDPDAYSKIGEAFLNWLPSILPTLQVLRLTGGEPIINPFFQKIINELSLNPVSHLHLAINTNLAVSDFYWNKFLDTLDQLKNKAGVSKLSVYTSLESVGTRAEHIRWGLDYNLFQKRIEYLIDHHPELDLIIMCTYNILCVQDFDLFLKQVHKWKKRCQNPQKLILDISLLRYPKFLSIQLLPLTFKETMKNHVEYFKKLFEEGFFEQYEFEKFKRIYSFFLTQRFSEAELSQHKKDLSIFLASHDQRRASDCTNVFSELNELF